MVAGKAVKQGPARYELFLLSYVTVRVSGKAAWLTGFAAVKMVGQESFRVTEVAGASEARGPMADGDASVDADEPVR